MTKLSLESRDRKRILIVDADARNLGDLSDEPPEESPLGEVTTVSDAESALVELEAGLFDVIVADVSLPGMDGVTLLKSVKTQFPKVIRILRSERNSVENSIQAMSVAHQMLTKSGGIASLQEIIERAWDLQERLTEATILSAVSNVAGLPSLPTVYAALMQALANPDIALSEIAEIVEQDAAISAKLLQVVNSAFFGLPREIARIEPALVYLGTNTIQSLVLSIEVFRPFQGKETVPGFSLPAEQRHSFLTAGIAKRLMKDRERSDAAFMAGLLHDIGKLIVASHFPDRIKQVLAAMSNGRQPMHTVEKDLFDLTHSDVGGYLLGLWGLPLPIVEAVAFHHAPAQVYHKNFDVVDAVHVGSFLAHKVESQLKLDEEMDLNHLRNLGVEREIDGWLQMATEVVAEGVPTI